MRVIRKFSKCVVATASVILFTAFLYQTSALAQSNTMTADELEEYIAQKKLALEEARKEKELNEEKSAKIKELLASKEEDQEKLIEEMEELCEERNKVEPGSYEACIDQLPSD